MPTQIELKRQGKIARLTNETFKFDERIKDGFFTANYFLKINKIISQNLPNHRITQQWFCRTNEYKLCGIDEAIALVETFARNPQNLEIFALHDGDIVKSREPVLKISGKYEDFGFLESVIDATLSRRSSVATNVWEVLKVAKNKIVFSMGDRQDEIQTQIGDGYATYVAGISRISTDAQGAWWGGRGVGTMPHALIQMCRGDIVRACKLYAQTFANEKITALVDYHNDVITDALRAANALGERLGAVRVDTSANLIDRYFERAKTGKNDEFTPNLAKIREKIRVNLVSNPSENLEKTSTNPAQNYDDKFNSSNLGKFDAEFNTNSDQISSAKFSENPSDKSTKFDTKFERTSADLCFDFDPHGVCVELIFALRMALDAHGFSHVKIVVSSGFTPQKIAEFERAKTPVDIYGAGTYLTRNDTCGFTADLVAIDGENEAKFGRENVENPRLERVNL